MIEMTWKYFIMVKEIEIRIIIVISDVCWASGSN